MVIELRVVQFWSEIILVISNRTHAARSFDFEITRMISDQIALHLVQLPLSISGRTEKPMAILYSRISNSTAVKRKRPFLDLVSGILFIVETWPRMFKIVT